jgi:cytochrome c biogenesis protein CcmG, thiol:disulfide interchange protein DsbE
VNRIRLATLLPVLLFGGLALLFWRGLSGEPSRLPSTLLGRTVPDFELVAVDGLGLPGLKTGDLRTGVVTIVNIWASWCGPCRDEHPLLMQLASEPGVRIVGINNKDNAANATRFLGALGNPFQAVGADTDGRVTIDWGGYGVPETFIVDGKGVIRHKHVGPLSDAALAGEFGAALKAAAQP